MFFFNDTATTEIYTLSLHDALPISCATCGWTSRTATCASATPSSTARWSCSRSTASGRSEEHTSELQSRQYLVCRLLLEKKKEVGRPAAAQIQASLKYTTEIHSSQ